MTARYLGWLLNPEDRERLLAAIPPAYPRIVAHHVTLRHGVPATAPLPRETGGSVLGLADDGHGVQALIVEIGGTTRRPDGSTFHITWSLADGRRPSESNAAIRAQGWRKLPEAYPVRLEPRLFP